MTGVRGQAVAGRAVAPAAPVAGPPGARLWRHLRDPLLGNVYALTLNTVVSSLLGIGYWVIAARLYPPEQLGVGAAVVSTMLFLSNLSQLNLNGALARFLPTSGAGGGRLIRYAYLLSGAAAVVVGVGFLLLGPLASDRLTPPAAGALFAALFVVAVAAWSVFTLQDTVLTALRGAIWVPVENAAFGILKIAMLVALLGVLPEHAIFLSWLGPALLALVPVNLLVFRRLLARAQRIRGTVEGLPDRRVLLRFVSLDYVGYLFLQAGTNALPLLVAASLGAQANAVFYVGWLLGTALELVAYHFGTSLTVESAAAPERLPAYARQVLRRGLLLFGGGALVLVATAPVLLRLFGSHYAQASAGVLRLFAIAVIPRLLITMFVAACRVRRTIGRVVAVHATVTTLVVGLAFALMPALGVTGVGVAYLTGQLLVAAAILPALLRLLRSDA